MELICGRYDAASVLYTQLCLRWIIRVNDFRPAGRIVGAFLGSHSRLKPDKTAAIHVSALPDSAMRTAFAGEKPFGELFFTDVPETISRVVFDGFDESQDVQFHGV